MRGLRFRGIVRRALIIILPFRALVIVALPLLLLGCPSGEQQEVKREKPPPGPGAHPPAVAPAKPEIMIRIASLDLSSYQKKVEKADILLFADQLKKERIDLLALGGITRYPGLSTRADIVDELSAGAEMRYAFGETITLNNRQGGNALFSVYPIRSSENAHYAGLQSNGFEAALQAVVDCGVRDLVVVSTKLPPKAALQELASASNLFTGLSTFYINHPIIIAGAAPRDAMLQLGRTYAEVGHIRNPALPRVWYSNDGSLRLDGTKVATTVFGSMVTVDFGIFRQ